MTRPIDARILVIDDYCETTRLVRNMLLHLGFTRVEEVLDGASALQKLRGQRYDLVICDWSMEPLTGYDVLVRIRENPELKLLPFIMMTGSGEPEQVTKAVSAGTTDYLLKPFNMATLRQKLVRILGEF